MTELGSYIEHGIHDIEGWMFPVDAELFAHLNDVVPPRGDLFEIGPFLGKSAIILGYLGGQVEVADLFDTPLDDEAQIRERQTWYRSLSRQRFEANWLRFHDELPVIHVGPSSDLKADELGRRFRVVHIDGSHHYDDVRADIALARAVTVDKSVVILDDIASFHSPGVAAAGWEAVLRDGFVPAVFTSKLYGSWDGGVAKRLRELGRDVRGGAAMTVVAGHDVVVPKRSATSSKPAASMLGRLARKVRSRLSR
jgi:Methyltransferase domain